MLKSSSKPLLLAGLAAGIALFAATSAANAVSLSSQGQSAIEQNGGMLWLAGPRYRGPYYGYPSYDYYDPPVHYEPYYGGYDYTPTPPPRRGSCWRWKRRCQANWGYGNEDFWGCMRYHGCN